MRRVPRVASGENIESTAVPPSRSHASEISVSGVSLPSIARLVGDPAMSVTALSSHAPGFAPPASMLIEGSVGLPAPRHYPEDLWSFESTICTASDRGRAVSSVHCSSRSPQKSSRIEIHPSEVFAQSETRRRSAASRPLLPLEPTALNSASFATARPDGSDRRACFLTSSLSFV